MSSSIIYKRFETPEASMEVDVAKGRRDWAFSERDKVNLVLYAYCIFIFKVLYYFGGS